jgi:predicted RNA-binding Zn ribbon-like protein
MDATEAGTRPAPSRLALVQAFVNTNDIEAGEDRLGSVDDARDWFLAHGLLATERQRVTRADLDRVHAVREALRDLVGANNSSAVEVDPSILENVAAEARLRLRFNSPGKITLEPRAPGVLGALGELLIICYESVIEGSWFHLKACRNDACRWIFFDRSKNHTSKWCRPDLCGNRMRARSHRLRHKQGP